MFAQVCLQSDPCHGCAELVSTMGCCEELLLEKLSKSVPRLGSKPRCSGVRRRGQDELYRVQPSLDMWKMGQQEQ